MSATQLQPESSISATFTVQRSDLASVISADTTDQFPMVLATSRLVAFMEITCARLLNPHVGTGKLSVGVRIDITHSAPTPEGAQVSATATFVGQEGKLYLFDVVASDSGGEIGRARHTRAIVGTERLMAGAQKRVAATYKNDL